MMGGGCATKLNLTEALYAQWYNSVEKVRKIDDRRMLIDGVAVRTRSNAVGVVGLNELLCCIEALTQLWRVGKFALHGELPG